MDTGIASERNAEHIVLMEPPNRNTAFFSTSNATDVHLMYFTGCCHRGHLFVMGLGSYTAAINPFIVCFKSWTNVPINYALRQSYLPLCNTPVAQGWTHAAVSPNITESIINGYNFHWFFLANGNYVVGPTSYWSTPVSVTSEAFYVGRQEYVVRFVLLRGDMENDGRMIRVLELETPIYDTGAAAWKQSLLRVYIDANGVIFRDVVGVDLATWTNNVDTWYEYMFIRSGYEFSIWGREYVDETESSIMKQWTLIYSDSNGSDTGAAGVNSFIYFGGIDITPGNWTMNTYWGFKMIATSNTITDIYPYKYNYKLFDNGFGGSYSPDIDRGVLSSEVEWIFDRADVANNLRRAVRGEFVSPNPIWVGNNWLALSYGTMASKALLWVNMLPRDMSITSVYITKNSGTFKGNLLLNPGAGLPMPLTPMGMYFAGNSCLELIGGITFNNLIDDFTLCAWVKPQYTGALSDGYIIARTTGVNTGFGLYFSATTDTVQLVGGTLTPSSDAVFTETEWLFITVVVKNSIAYFYKNGIAAGSGSVGTIPTSSLDVVIGADSTQLANLFRGYILKAAIFDYVLSHAEIRNIYTERPYGPMIPSDFFIRCFGSKLLVGRARAYDTWRLLAKDYGGAADNILDNNPGSKYYSSKDGKYGSTPGGVGYNDGDVEVSIYRTGGGFITADSVYVGNCNATDVAIYAQDADPLTAGWIGATFLGNYQLHWRDEHNGEPLNLLYDAAAGVVTSGIIIPTETIRHGRYVNKRLLICPGTNPDQYGVGANPIDNYIQKVVYNSDDTIQIDERLSVGPAQLWVRELSDRLLIRLDDTYTYRYWRFIFTNNANNGDYISVGTVRLGLLALFNDNIDMNFSYARAAEEVNLGGVDIGIPHYLAYNSPKYEFDIKFTMSDIRSMTNDISLLQEAFKISMMYGEPIYFTRGFYSGQNGTSLVYQCAPSGDLQQEIPTITTMSQSLKLKEL